METTRRPASQDDKPFVRGVNRQAYEELIVRLYGEWDERAQDSYFDQKWERADFEVVEVAGERIGAIWTTEDGDHLRLHEIFLLPDWQGRGIGSGLVKQELATARRLGKPLRLSVLRGNRARALYERLGFAVTEETETKVWMEARPT